ncbi:MAG: DUF6273 domain-containing protein [Eubacterium sp.]
MLAVTVITLNKSDINDTFHGLSALCIAWIYFIAQAALSIWQMVSFKFPYFYGIIADTVLAAAAIILLILTYAASVEIKANENKIAEKVFYIKNLQSDIELLVTNDVKLAGQIKDLRDTVRFSDPISHSQLTAVENKIENKFNLLKENIDNIGMATIICDEMQQLLADRNKKCKLLKNVPEPKKGKDNSGINILSVTFGILTAAAVFILVVCFVIVPNNKYNKAVSLYSGGQYEEALTAFEALGNYKDSLIKTHEIKEKILDEKYQSAEDCYKNQQYAEAVSIYNELGNYKDSKDKIEQIFNKLAIGDEIYFGFYQGVPIAWKILRTEKSRMLLITDSPVEQLAFNNELKNITYENSTIREWLNNEFLSEFSDEQISRILKTDELNDNIFLLNEEEYRSYAENISFKTQSDWWLRTKTAAGMMFVSGESGEVNTYGESVVRNMGVRPCVWISLK